MSNVRIIGSATGCAQWGWDDSGNLSIPKPPGLLPGDLIMALLGNHADGDVGAGFTEGAGMPAMSRLFLHSSPGGDPGTNGGTLDWRYWTYLGTEPDPFNWSCAAILDLGVVVAFRNDDGDPITPNDYGILDHCRPGVTTHPTGTIAGAPDQFLVACWYTQSGGIYVGLDIVGDPSLTETIYAIDPGTLRQLELVEIGNSPDTGTIDMTATTTLTVDTCAYLTAWAGTLIGNRPCFSPAPVITPYIPEIVRFG